MGVKATSFFHTSPIKEKDGKDEMIVILQEGLRAIILISLLFTNCFQGFEPPSKEEATAFLMQHREDINTIVDYLSELEFSYAYIDDDKGVFYDLGWHSIPSNEVNTSVHRLRLSGCTNIDKEANTISFQIWSRTMGSVDCGIACIIDGHVVSAHR
ncbi:MAG: hypothetical protein IJG15_03690 [Lachnospiraceae bacterium]|nr:hypothetical protein [Lachnospiraceae bacterium]